MARLRVRQRFVSEFQTERQGKKDLFLTWPVRVFGTDPARLLDSVLRSARPVHRFLTIIGLQ